MARREVESLMGKLRQLSEDGAASFFSEVMASERLRKGLGRAGERFLSNKESFNSNVESILDFVNIPSKRDVRELKSRLDTLSTQLVNLSMKVDRMMAQEAGQTKRSTAATEDLGTTARLRGGDDEAGKGRNKAKRRSK